MKKRILALVLGMTFVVSSLAGCGESSEKESSVTAPSQSQETSQAEEQSSQASSDGTEVPDEIPVDYFAGTTLKISVVHADYDPSTVWEQDKDFIKMAEEATGIHIEWDPIPESVLGDRVSVMLASDEQPDAYLGFIGTETIAANMELFYDMSEEGLLETYAPKVLEDYEAGGQGILERLTWPDGSIRSLAGGSATSYTTNGAGAWFINKTWLDKVGMDIPTNAEEFYEVLCAFRDGDMDGDGRTDNEIPLSFTEGDWCSHFLEFADSWGLGGGEPNNNWSYYARLNDDGILEPLADQEVYREFLEYYHKLYAEGLLDAEGFSQTWEQFYAKRDEGRIGVYVGWTPADPENYVGMVPFQAKEDTPIVKTGTWNGMGAKLYGLSIAAECENVEAVLHWWNYLSSSLEMKATMAYGPEGICWEYVEGGGYRTMDAPEEVRGGMTAQEYGYAHHAYMSPYMTPSELPNIDPENARVKLVKMTEEYLLPNTFADMTKKVADPLKLEERKFMEADLFPMMDAFMANSVVEGIDDASWNKYLEDLKTYGFYEWIQWYQDFLDGKF